MTLVATCGAAVPNGAHFAALNIQARRAFLWSDESELGPHQRLMRALAARAPPRWSQQGAQGAQDAWDPRVAASLQPSVVELQQ